MDYFRKLYWTNYFWCLFTLHLFNISVDAPDSQPVHIAEDLSINDPESIAEFVLEHIFGFEDAFPETDDDDSNSISGSLPILCFLSQSASFQFSVFCISLLSVTSYGFNQEVGVNPFLNGCSPPPERC